MLQNILDTFNQASDRDIIEGLNWYNEASIFADSLAETFHIEKKKAANVIAVFSINASWRMNKIRAFDFLSDPKHYNQAMGKTLEQARAVYYKNETPRGPKIERFAECIRSNGHTETACIDRHAYAIATGKHPKHAPTRQQIERVEIAYQHAAQILRDSGIKITACQLQAITWIVYRKAKFTENQINEYGQ